MPNGDEKLSQCSKKSGIGRVRVGGSIPGRNKRCFLLQMFITAVALSQPLTKGYRMAVPEVDVAGE